MTKGTIKDREAFLTNVAHQLGRDRITSPVKRPSWNHQVQWNVLADHTQEQLVDVLEAHCQSIHTSFVRTDFTNLNEALLKVIHDFGGKSVITWDDPRFEAFSLSSCFRDWNKEGIIVDKWEEGNGEQSIRRAEQADVGITFSDRTLAESGTVVLFSDKGKGRSVSLLPATYIAIVPKSTIVPRMSQVTREIHNQVENGKPIPSCINFITGPSNSADIEMNLVVGVHGPIKAAYVLVEDR